MSKTLDELEADLDAATSVRATAREALTVHCEANKAAMHEMHRLDGIHKHAGRAVGRSWDALRAGYADAMAEQRKARR